MCQGHSTPMLPVYYSVPSQGQLVQLEVLTWCHCHGCSTRLSLDSFFYFAKSNSSHPLVDLIFLLILSIHMTLILSYPSFHDHYLTLYLSFKCVGLFYDDIRNLSGPLYPNALHALFCAFPRPASPTSSTYLVGCLSPM